MTPELAAFLCGVLITATTTLQLLWSFRARLAAWAIANDLLQVRCQRCHDALWEPDDPR